MLVELTARSAEIITREQAERGTISPEHLIEQALEAYLGMSSPHTTLTIEELRSSIEEGWQDSEAGRTVSAEQGWAEIDRAVNRQ